MIFHHRLPCCILLAALSLPLVAPAAVTVTPIPVAPPPALPGTPANPTDTAAPSGAFPTTADEAKSLYDAGNYKDALRVISHLLEIRGPNAAFNRQQVLILRAECQLEIHEVPSAVGSLQTAETEAQTMGLTDDALTALALRMLVQKSSNSLYTPIAGTDHNPINILDKTKRKAAYDALFADDLAVVKQRLQSATTNQILPPLVDVAKELPGLRALEHASAEGTTATDSLAKEATKQAVKIVYSALSDFEGKISRISNAANRMIPDNVTSNSFGVRYHRQGLGTDDVQTLHDIMNSCAKLLPMLGDFGKSFNAADAFAPVKARTQSVSDRAHTLLNSDYRVP